MRNNPPLPAPSLLPPRLPLQALEGVERAADLEGADALEVLALEIQAYLWACWCYCWLLPLPLWSRLCPLLSRRRSNPIERRVPERGRVVHELPDQLARLEHRGPRQRRRGRGVRHSVSLSLSCRVVSACLLSYSIFFLVLAELTSSLLPSSLVSNLAPLSL